MDLFGFTFGKTRKDQQPSNEYEKVQSVAVDSIPDGAIEIQDNNFAVAVSNNQYVYDLEQAINKANIKKVNFKYFFFTIIESKKKTANAVALCPEGNELNPPGSIPLTKYKS